MVLLYQSGTTFAHIEDSHWSATRTAAAHATHHKHPHEQKENQGAETPQKVAEEAAILLIGYITVKIAQFLLVGKELVQFVIGGVLGFHIRHPAPFYGHVLEHVTNMLRVHIHLQFAIVLVGNDTLGISVLHIGLEFAIGHRLTASAHHGGLVVTGQYQITQYARNDNIYPGQIDLGTIIVLLVFFFHFSLFLILQYPFGSTSVQIWDEGQFRIGPQMFDVIEVALFLQEYVHHHVRIVHCHPMGIMHAVHCQGMNMQFAAHFVVHTRCQGIKLCGRTTGTYYHVVANGVGDYAQVHIHYIAAFLILKCVNDDLHHSFCTI